MLCHSLSDRVDLLVLIILYTIPVRSVETKLLSVGLSICKGSAKLKCICLFYFVFGETIDGRAILVSHLLVVQVVLLVLSVLSERVRYVAANFIL